MEAGHPSLQHGLVPADKAERVRRFQQNTLEALRGMLGAMGIAAVFDVDGRFFSASDPIRRCRRDCQLCPSMLLEGAAPREVAERSQANATHDFSVL